MMVCRSYTKGHIKMTGSDCSTMKENVHGRYPEV